MEPSASLPLYQQAHPFREFIRRWKECLAQGSFRVSFLISFVLFIIGDVVINGYAIQFAAEKASNPVTDIILSNTRAFDVDGIFVYSTIVMLSSIAILILTNPKRILFTLNSITLLIVIRSFFTSLTHLGPFPVQTAVTFTDPAILKLFFGADYFFSGHTALPFLIALIYWRDISVRYFYLAVSVFFATIVLLGHLHYSIDVASAFFITYTVYCIAEWLMPRYRKLFYAESPTFPLSKPFSQV